MCRIKFYVYRKVFLGGRYEKVSKGEKGLFQDMLIFFLKFIFDRIFIPPLKKMGVYRTCAVRSVVTLLRLSDILFNFARTGVSISEL